MNMEIIQRTSQNEQLSLKNNSLSINSLEMSMLVGSRHDKVKQSIERLVAGGSIAHPPVGVVQEIGGNNRSYETQVYTFSGEKGKRDSIVVVAQLSPEFTARLVDRWQELEKALTDQTPKLPNFSNPAEAARAWAEQYEATIAANEKLALAAPKVEFVDRYVDGKGSKGFRQVAKLLSIKEPEFRLFLQEEQIMYRLGGEWVPYAQHIDAGRFEVKTGQANNGHAFNTAKFTPKGIEWIAAEWAKYQIRGQQQ